MKEDVGRLGLGAWILVMVVCFLGVENIQAKEPSMNKEELITELEPDVRGQVDVPAGMDSIALYFIWGDPGPAIPVKEPYLPKPDDSSEETSPDIEEYPELEELDQRTEDNSVSEIQAA